MQDYEITDAAIAEVAAILAVGFRTIIIDTIDNAYKFCTDHIVKKYKIEHESDLGYGKGYALVNNEFQRVLTKLAFLPYGLFLISHAKEIEVDIYEVPLMSHAQILSGGFTPGTCGFSICDRDSETLDELLIGGPTPGLTDKVSRTRSRKTVSMLGHAGRSTSFRAVASRFLRPMIPRTTGLV